MRFRLSKLKRAKMLIETTIYDTLFVTVFRSLRFHLSTLETKPFQTMRFQKDLLLKPFSKAFIGVFGRFGVNDRPKRVQKCKDIKK